MQELQARQRAYQKTLQAREQILRFWKDLAARNNALYERRPLDLVFDNCPIYAQCTRSRSFTPDSDEQLRHIKHKMLTASSLPDNSPLHVIFSFKGPRRCQLWREQQALEEQRPEEHRRNKEACLQAELRALAVGQNRFREIQTRNRGFFVPADLILQDQVRERDRNSPRGQPEWITRTLSWDGHLGDLKGVTMEKAIEWAEWVSRGAPRCERFWRGAFLRWSERGCAQMYGTNALPIGTINLKGRWRHCKWEEPSGRVRSHVSVHDAVNCAAQRIQRFFLMAHAKVMAMSLRGETLRQESRSDPLTLAFSFASQAVIADYEGRFADACELYGQAVSTFVTVNSEPWSDKFPAFMHESNSVSWMVGREYFGVFSLRMEELRRAVETDNSVLRAEQEVLRVQQDIARLKEEMGIQARLLAVREAAQARLLAAREAAQARLLAAREVQQQLRRAARKERKRHQQRTARTARKEQLRLQREQLTTQLSGEWKTFDATDGTVYFLDLDVCMSGLDSPFLWFNDVSSNGVLEYKYVNGERILARLVGDTLIWSDRSVYRRVILEEQMYPTEEEMPKDLTEDRNRGLSGSMEISDETGVDDDVDDIPGGVRAVFVGGAYGWDAEDENSSVSHLGHVSVVYGLMPGGYFVGDCSNRTWLYHHYEYIKGDDFTAYRCGAAD